MAAFHAVAHRAAATGLPAASGAWTNIGTQTVLMLRSPPTSALVMTSSTTVFGDALDHRRQTSPRRDESVAHSRTSTA